MDKNKYKAKKRARRKHHIRKQVFGTAERPRLSVFRSNSHLYCQLIDDEVGKTLAAASTRSKALRDGLSGKTGNRAAAKEVGKLLAETAKSAGIKAVVFDRNGYKFHGRIKELADAARESGLEF